MTDEQLRLSESQVLRILRSTPAALELESTWSPGGDPPRTHWHPRQDEHFEVLDGELTVRIGVDERVLTPGETLDVPARTAHAMWNAGTTPCRATWTVRPAGRTAEMFRTIDSSPGPLGLVRMLWTFRHEFRLGSPRSARG